MAEVPPSPGSVAIVTLGCARNEVDSEELAGRLDSAGFSLVDDPQRAAAVGAAGRRRATEGLLWPQQVPALLDAVQASLDARAAPA